MIEPRRHSFSRRRALAEVRFARLGGRRITLPGSAPRAGDRLTARFELPPARNATAPLCATDLSAGLVFVSTLPNVAKSACLAQIVDLDEHTQNPAGEGRVVLVSADHASNWREVDEFHPDVRAPAYTLDGASAEHRAAFVRAFGVEVAGHRRIAHGLFALIDGVFLTADVPFDQMSSPDVAGFLTRVRRLSALLRSSTAAVAAIATTPHAGAP